MGGWLMADQLDKKGPGGVGHKGRLQRPPGAHGAAGEFYRQPSVTPPPHLWPLDPNTRSLPLVPSLPQRGMRIPSKAQRCAAQWMRYDGHNAHGHSSDDVQRHRSYITEGGELPMLEGP